MWRALPGPDRRGAPWRTWALALVSGGAAGNLVDRIHSPRGVVDFLDVGVGATRWADVQRRRRRGEHGGDPPRHRALARGRAAARPARPRTSRPRDPGRSVPARTPFPTDDVAGERLDLAVARLTGLSRTQAATLIATGKVTVSGPHRARELPLRAGRGPCRSPSRPPPGREIVAERIDVRSSRTRTRRSSSSTSPRGWWCTPRRGTGRGTLVNALMGRGQGLAGRRRVPSAPDSCTGSTRRRRDSSSWPRPTRAHRTLSAALAAPGGSPDGTPVSRGGHLDQDRISVDKPLGRDPNDRTRVAVRPEGRDGAGPISSAWRASTPPTSSGPHLHTGRTHQIRVHLASIGHPVVG
jgi:23S rRNA pseudouridine1911/1915/1917 synthase